MEPRELEQAHQKLGHTAPRVTPADLQAAIATEYYINAGDAVGATAGFEFKHDEPMSLMTVCFLVLRNGFVVVGKSACASPENYSAELGRRLARDNAVQQLWPLLGYALREKLHQEA